MASQQQIEDDGMQVFVKFIRREYPNGLWNRNSRAINEIIEKTFIAGYKEGRKDG